MFNKNVKVGTKVLVIGFGWDVVKSVHSSGRLIECNSAMGSFQRGHIAKYSNK